MDSRTTLHRAVPAARTIDLVTTYSNDEVLVYDQAAHHIHHLNASATLVWYLCDGKRSVNDIALETGLTQDAVKLALRTLEDAQLLDAPLATSMRGTQSRRSFMKKAGIAAIPAIVSITAPIAKAAASGGECKNSDDCKRIYGSTVDGKDVDWNCSGSGHPSGKGVCYYNPAA